MRIIDQSTSISMMMMTQTEELYEYMSDLETFFIENVKILNKIGKVNDIGLNDDERGNTSLQIDRSISFNKKGDVYAEFIDIIPESKTMLEKMPFNINTRYNIALLFDSVEPEDIEEIRIKIDDYFRKIGKPKMFQGINLLDEKEKMISIVIGTSRRFSIDRSEEPFSILEDINSISKELYNACDKLDQVLA